MGVTVTTTPAPATGPANSSSPTGSYDASACVCNIGYAGY
jgi:hypothetical protein